MAQKPQFIDITRSYVPGDPNAFPENLVSTQAQDGEEKAPPVSIYEGHNFLPTPYGYKSYFGTTSRLDVPDVPARAQFILSYQSAEYVNNLIALCEDGIWIIDPTANTNTWKHVIVHTYDADIFEEWTWCVIENALYCYKQGGASYYHTSDVDDVTNDLDISIITVVPTFLNMSGQMGIFKAGTRLGFWDSANSVAWSSNLDLHDLTPSLENLAGNTIFGAVVGRITHIRDHGEGFIVYSTKSIVGVSYDASSNMLWDAHAISNTCGVAVGRSVTHGGSNNEQFAYTTSGMYKIGGYNGLTKVYEFQPVAVELMDLIKESREPVYLDCIEGRFLYIHCINSNYINGKISFESFTVDQVTVDTIPAVLPSRIPSGLFIKKMQKIERDTMDSTYGATLVKYVTDGTPFDVVEWEVSYKTISPLGLAEKYKEPSVGGSFAYADAGSLDRTSLGWDNRTPVVGVFGDVDGVYSSLEHVTVLPTLADFTTRGTEAQDDISSKVSALMLYQEDALGGTFSTSYNLQKPLVVEPSYLVLSGANTVGMIEGLYNVESLWKDFEKRQKLAIDRFTEIVDGLEDSDWKAYSTSNTLEATIEAPVYSIFNLYKPYGNVGVQRQGKGFFFYKQYRDMWDCAVISLREVAAPVEKKMTGDGEYEADTAVALEDSLEVSITTISGGEAAFPNPTQFGISVASVAGGAWTSENSGYTMAIAVKNIASGESSDYITKSVYMSTGRKLRITVTEEIDTAYVLSFYLVVDNISVYPGTRVVTLLTITAAGVYDYNNSSELPSEAVTFPYINIQTEGNVVVPPYEVGQWTTVATDVEVSSWYVGTTEMWISKNLNGKRSAPLYLGEFTTLNPDVVPVFNGPAFVAGEHATVYFKWPAAYEQGYTQAFDISTVDFPEIEVGVPISGLYWDMMSGNYSSAEIAMFPDLRADHVVTWAESSPGVPTEYTAVVTSPVSHSPTFLRYLAEDSQLTPIHFPEPDVYVSLRDLDYYTQSLTSPWTSTGKSGVQAYSAELPGSDIVATIKPLQTLSLPNDYLTAEPEVAVQFKVQKESAETHEEYPFLMSPVGDIGTIGDLVGYYQSFEQASLLMSMYARYLTSVMQFALLPSSKQMRPSLSMDDYRVEYNEGVIELWCDQIVEAFNPRPVSAVVALLHQTSGFVYEYDVQEELSGSIQASIDVDLSGASLYPTLDNEGVFNTVGGFFSPKNKISATLNAGILSLGAVTAIDDYDANEAEILDFLQPANNLFLTDKYLLPPTYDDGERWYLIEAADTIYETGTPFHHKEGSISSIDTPVWATPLYLPDYPPYDIPADDAVVIIGDDTATLPGATFNLQVGTPAPAYPLFKGAYVFDLHLKKWGKMKNDYRNLVSFSPLNSNLNGAITYTNFGMDCGVVLDSDEISLFDKVPVDSWIRYGKIGYYRLGMTTVLEARAMFRSVFNGSVIIDTSMDGRTLSIPLRHAEDFNNVINVVAYPAVSGRWHTIKIEGNYDLQYLEVRGTIGGRR